MSKLTTEDWTCWTAEPPEADCVKQGACQRFVGWLSNGITTDQTGGTGTGTGRGRAADSSGRSERRGSDEDGGFDEEHC